MPEAKTVYRVEGVRGVAFTSEAEAWERALVSAIALDWHLEEKKIATIPPPFANADEVVGLVDQVLAKQGAKAAAMVWNLFVASMGVPFVVKGRSPLADVETLTLQ